MTRFARLAAVLGFAAVLAGCGSAHGRVTTSTAQEGKYPVGQTQG